MVASDRNAQGSKAAPLRTTWHQTKDSTTSKVRDSCQGCAVSKVKCHKEKPTCSRCASRGMTCEYFITKRPGRKPDSGQRRARGNSSDLAGIVAQKATTEDNMQTTTSPLQHSTIPKAKSQSSQPLPPVILGDPSNTDLEISDLAIAPLDTVMSGVVSELGLPGQFEFDDHFPSPSGFGELDWLDGSYVNGFNEVPGLLISDDLTPSPASEISPTAHLTLSSDFFLNATDSSVGQTAMASNGIENEIPKMTSCQCLMRVLEFLKKLSSSYTSNPNFSSDVEFHSPTAPQSGQVSPHEIIQENKRIIEKAYVIVQCSCAEDRYLLAMMSMAVFKLLDRYAQAAQEEPEDEIGNKTEYSLSPSDQSSKRRDSGGYSDGYSQRVASRLVLGELHRVQRLVNLLSPKLRAHQQMAGSNIGAYMRKRPVFDAFGGSLHERKSQTTYLVTVLDQMESDLRRCLGNLSSEIIRKLRHT